MTYPITQIRGIGTDAAGILKKQGIRTTIALLRAAKTPKQRLRLAAKTGADPKKILGWVTAADRMRIKGVGFGYAELLRSAGVRTVSDLKLRNPQNLAESLGNAANRKLVRLLPKQRTLERWIESAKKLPAIISY
ncbi:MAG: DUF4332 domain-containing protein [Xanthobacteraceae bacterium]